MRDRFNEELDNLNQSVRETGDLCTEAVSYASEALMDGNSEKAKDVFSIHRHIHTSERKIESACLKLLMEQQPVAKDLRMISACLKASYDLERIGEMSADIAEIILNEDLSASNDMFDLHSMSCLTIKMTKDALLALTNRDNNLAETVIQTDDTIDDAFNKAKKKIEEHFQKGANVEYALNLLMVAKYYEKIGDHTVNIAKWTIFINNGMTPDIN